MTEFLNPGGMELDVEGSYLDRMLKGKQAWPQYSVPGWPEPIRIRVLSQGDENICHAEAVQYVQKNLMLDPVKNEQLVGSDAAIRIIYEATVTKDSTPEKIKHLAVDYESFRDSPVMTEDVVELLWKAYKDTKLTFSPRLSQLSTETMHKYKADLKKNPASIVTERWPRAWLMDLIDFLVSQESSSTGSSANTTSSSED